MIILNCTTDYDTQVRSIKVDWLLNSTIPEDIPYLEYSVVQTCNSSINCGNGSYTNGVCHYIMM